MGVLRPPKRRCWGRGRGCLGAPVSPSLQLSISPAGPSASSDLPRFHTLFSMSARNAPFSWWPCSTRKSSVHLSVCPEHGRVAWSPFTSLLGICFIPRGQGGHATCPWSPALPSFLSGLHAPRGCDHRHSTGLQVPCEQPLGSPDFLPSHRGRPHMCVVFFSLKKK